MAAKKKAENIDYKEICEFYEHLLDHKNMDIEFLSEENDTLRKAISSKDSFATKQAEKILSLDKELLYKTREFNAVNYSKELLRDDVDSLVERVNGMRTDRVALTVLSIFLGAVIIFAK